MVDVSFPRRCSFCWILSETKAIGLHKGCWWLLPFTWCHIHHILAECLWIDLLLTFLVDVSPTESSPTHPRVNFSWWNWVKFGCFFRIPWLCKAKKTRVHYHFPGWKKSPSTQGDTSTQKSVVFQPVMFGFSRGYIYLFFKDPSGIGFSDSKKSRKKRPPSKGYTKSWMRLVFCCRHTCGMRWRLLFFQWACFRHTTGLLFFWLPTNTRCGFWDFGWLEIHGLIKVKGG